MVPLHGIPETRLPQPILRQALEVNVGAGQLRLVGEAPGFGEPDPVLGDQRVAVPSQVGRRLPEPRRGVQVGG